MSNDKTTPEVAKVSPGQTNREWFVMVRHTTLLKKNAFVFAPTAEAAKQEFLKLAKAAHDAKAGKHQANEEGRKSVEAIRDAYDHGVNNTPPGNWTIRPADEVRRERERQEKQRQEFAERAMAKA